MNKEKIDRINVLAKKAKTKELTDDEKIEQEVLRREYIDSFKNNLRSTLDSVLYKKSDGSAEDKKI